VLLPVTLSGAVVPGQAPYAVLAFMLIYGSVMVIVSMRVLFRGMDPVSAATAAIACINTTGPGLGQVGPAANYRGLSDFRTWVCTFAMMLGRLEMLNVLVLFTPQFRRKWRSAAGRALAAGPLHWRPLGSRCREAARRAQKYPVGRKQHRAAGDAGHGGRARRRVAEHRLAHPQRHGGG
jgi:hypothetical protein